MLAGRFDSRNEPEVGSSLLDSGKACGMPVPCADPLPSSNDGPHRPPERHGAHHVFRHRATLRSRQSSAQRRPRFFLEKTRRSSHQGVESRPHSRSCDGKRRPRADNPCRVSRRLPRGRGFLPPHAPSRRAQGPPASRHRRRPAPPFRGCLVRRTHHRLRPAQYGILARRSRGNAPRPPSRRSSSRARFFPPAAAAALDLPPLPAPRAPPRRLLSHRRKIRLRLPRRFHRAVSPRRSHVRPPAPVRLS